MQTTDQEGLPSQSMRPDVDRDDRMTVENVALRF